MRRSSTWRSLGWTVKDSGTSACACPIRSTTDASTAVTACPGASPPCCASGRSRPCTLASAGFAEPASERVEAKASSRCSWKLRTRPSVSSSVRSPRSTRVSMYCLRVETFSLMSLYISGCVIEGSSPSLWPRRR